MYRDLEIEEIYLKYLKKGFEDNGLHVQFLSKDRTGDLSNPIIQWSIISRLKNYLTTIYRDDFLLYYFIENEILMVVRVGSDMKEITALFPYEEYDLYFDMLDELNKLVSSDGYIEVFANNVYYQLEAGVAIKTSENFDEIKRIITSYGLEIDYSKNLEEISKAQREKQYNSMTLAPFLTKEILPVYLSSIFILPPKSAYKKNGYGDKLYSKPKLFVSYCHKDKAVVHEIIDRLREYGLDFWLDEEQIDIGDRIIDKVSEGMQDSDLPIIFLSNNTKESMFASHELKTFLNDVIYDKSASKSWFIVKVDDVVPDEVVKGLGQFMYYDYHSEKKIDYLADKIKKKISK